MDIEKALEITDQLVFEHTGKHLSFLEEQILRGTLQGKAYKEINIMCGYSLEYVRNRAASLWQKLSDVLKEEVAKKNLQTVLTRRAALQDWGKAPNYSMKATGQDWGKAPNYSMKATGQDWGKAPNYSVFYGRDEELTMLKQWIVTERCRVVAVLGIGGIGKTTLAVKLTKQIQAEFDYVIWRGLRNASPIEKILAEIIKFLSNQQETDLPETLEDKISRLLYYLHTSRCLLVLDNFESILRSSDLAGYYQEGYEGYGELIRQVGEASHQSCLVLTSREKPREIALLERETIPVRSLELSGLDEATAGEILEEKDLSDQQYWQKLILLYRGNPLALYLVSGIIKDLFGGSVYEFLRMDTLFIVDIFNELLEQQFNRLSELEKQIIYFLAIQQKPISLGQLIQQFQTDRPNKSEVIQAVESLNRRSLLEKITEGSHRLFTLQPVMIEYIRNITLWSPLHLGIASDG